MAARRSVRAEVPARGGTKCTCKPVLLIAVVILATIGVYAMVSGFVMQFNASAPMTTTSMLTIMAWYLGGIIALVLAKMAKWKAFCCCMKHKG